MPGEPHRPNPAFRHFASSTLLTRDPEDMLRLVEVLHEGRWLPATLMATRLDADGWHGLVGYTDPLTREGFYRWHPEENLRAAPDATEPGQAAAAPAAASP